MAVRTREATTQAAIDFLLASREPAIRFLTRRDVLGEDVTVDRDEILSGPLVRGLLRGQKRDGGFGGHPYAKWRGAHWRLVSLVELGVPGDDRLQAAAGTVLDWLTSDRHRKSIQIIDGLTRRCGSQEGNALAVCSRLGMADDPRVQQLARSLVEWQWPDGGWNCDKKASGRRSSFNESLPPMWGLHEYWLATGEQEAKESADRTAELFLEHDLFRTLKTGEPIHPGWLVAHYPPYWHYEVPQALLILSRAGKVDDPRTADALDILVGLQHPDGCWHKGPVLVAQAGLSGQQRRGRRLGRARAERDDHAQCAPHPQGRRPARTSERLGGREPDQESPAGRRPLRVDVAVHGAREAA